MALYYLNPEDEPRECDACRDNLHVGYAVNCTPTDGERGDLWACAGCLGTGKLGNPDGPRVHVFVDPRGTWNWRDWVEWGDTQPEPHGTYPTESAALEAARKAWREE